MTIGPPDDDPAGVGQGGEGVVEVVLAGSRVTDLNPQTLKAQPRDDPGLTARFVTAVGPASHPIEPCTTQVGHQAPAIPGIPASRQCGPVPGAGDGRQRCRRGLSVEKQSIGVFHHQPAATAQGRSQVPDRCRWLPQMFQDQAGVNQIEAAARQAVTLKIMADNGDIAVIHVSEATDVNIARQHRAALGDLPGQPYGHRPPARTHLPAPPASGQPQLEEDSLADQIELPLEARQALLLRPPRFIKRVCAHLPILPR